MSETCLPFADDRNLFDEGTRVEVKQVDFLPLDRKTSHGRRLYYYYFTLLLVLPPSPRVVSSLEVLVQVVLSFRIKTRLRNSSNPDQVGSCDL